MSAAFKIDTVKRFHFNHCYKGVTVEKEEALEALGKMKEENKMLMAKAKQVDDLVDILQEATEVE